MLNIIQNLQVNKCARNEKVQKVPSAMISANRSVDQVNNQNRTADWCVNWSIDQFVNKAISNNTQ